MEAPPEIQKVFRSYNEVRLLREMGESYIRKSFSRKEVLDREVSMLWFLQDKTKNFVVPRLLEVHELSIDLEYLKCEPKRQDDSYWFSYGKALRELNQLAQDAEGESREPPDLLENVRYLCNTSSARVSELHRCASILSELGEELIARDISKRAILGAVHGDPNAGNAFLTRDGLCLVDFERSSNCGDIRVDYVLGKIHADKHEHAFEAGYEANFEISKDDENTIRVQFLAGNLYYIASMLYRSKLSERRLDLQYNRINERMLEWFGIPLVPARAKARTLSNDYPLDLSSTPNEADVSVVIPTYNTTDQQKKIFELCINSFVEHQDSGQLEIIVVDDGSPIAVDAPRGVEVVRHETNQGRSAARNSGARVAQGEILSFVDSDVALSKQVGFLRETREHLQRAARQTLLAGICERVEASEFLTNPSQYLCRRPVQKNDFRFFKRSSSGMEFRLLKETERFRQLGYEKRYFDWSLPYVFATFHCAMFRTLFEEIGGFDERFQGWGAEDNHFAACAIAQGAFVRPTTEPLVYHVRHNLRDHRDETEKALQLQRNQLLSEV